MSVQFSKPLILMLSICFAMVQSATAQQKVSYLYDPGKAPREHFVDMQHLFLEVAFAPEVGKVSGTVTHTFTPKRDHLDKLFLDGIRMNIISAALDGKAINFVAS